MPTYDHQWFKERAFKSLHKISEGVWDYTDSLLLYTPAGSDEYASMQSIQTDYARLVTEPEREYLAAIASQVAAALPNEFEYIDLGPGTEHKEQFLFDELKKQGKRFTYVPVDVSQQYLDLAVAHASAQGIPVRAAQSSFEDLPNILPQSGVPRFVSLGLTFGNYDPEVILTLLKRIAGQGGYAFINPQMRDRVDMPALVRAYQVEAAGFVGAKLALLDLNAATDVAPTVADDGVRITCTVRTPSPKLQEIGVVVGDTLVVVQSLRYTKEQLADVLSSTTHTLLDTDSSFIAALIKT